MILLFTQIKGIISSNEPIRLVFILSIHFGYPYLAISLYPYCFAKSAKRWVQVDTEEYIGIVTSLIFMEIRFRAFKNSFSAMIIL